jgi:hypothetical protein
MLCEESTLLNTNVKLRHGWVRRDCCFATLGDERRLLLHVHLPCSKQGDNSINHYGGTCAVVPMLVIYFSWFDAARRQALPSLAKGALTRLPRFTDWKHNTCDMSINGSRK